MRSPLLFLILPFRAFPYDPCIDPEPGFLTGTFPDGFIWSAAGASFQIEGGWNIDGKGPSTWDVFNHRHPDPVAGNATGDIACDSFHRWKEDILLLQRMNLKYYRLSISWPRILPKGLPSSGINEAGISYYLSLLKALNAAGIQPMVTEPNEGT